jgi:hypothetical protein
MDTMKLLLGATIALLLAAIVMSYQQSRQQVANAAPDELQRLRQQLDELRLEQERIEIERRAREYRDRQPVTLPGIGQPSANNPEIEAMKAELAAKEAALRAIEEEKAKAERDAQVYRDEAGLLGQRKVESGDRELQRARMISDALLVARIIGFTEDEFGGFVTIELLMPELVQPNETLAIRRNTGILGLISVTTIEGREAVGTPLPGVGPIDPRAGDELIIPPPID